MLCYSATPINEAKQFQAEFDVNDSKQGNTGHTFQPSPQSAMAELLSVTERPERQPDSETCLWMTATTNDGSGSGG